MANKGKRHSVGGRFCPCCNKWNRHPRKMKALERRYLRHRTKQLVGQLVQLTLNEEPELEIYW